LFPAGKGFPLLFTFPAFSSHGAEPGQGIYNDRKGLPAAHQVEPFRGALDNAATARYAGRMQNVDFLLIAAVTLFIAQAVLLLIRTSSCIHHVEPLTLAAFLFFLALWLVMPRALIRGPILLLSLWAGGVFLFTAAGRRNLGWWSGVSAGFPLALLLAGLLGYQNSVPYVAFRAFGIALLSVPAIGELFRLWRASRSRLALITLLSCCIWLAAGSGSLALDASGSPLLFLDSIPALLLASCTGLLIFHDGYPLQAGWRGGLVGLRARDRLAQEVFAKLLEKENALARQNRLIASGLLAVGAAHEFKNMLAHIRTTAEHGLRQSDARRKDDCFRLLLQHAETGRDTTIGLLENISRDGREKPRVIDAARDLAGFFRMLRAAFRGDGILIETDLASGIRFRCRRDEVEQVLLNLVRNAAEIYRAGPSAGERLISVTARRQEEMAVLEVKDKAGGVPVDAAHRLFTMSSTGTGSTGLGLSLSRSLATQNEGSLEYEPVEGGSIFRLAFPIADEDAPAADMPVG
jgi:signal transduction histidine kinase